MLLSFGLDGSIASLNVQARLTCSIATARLKPVAGIPMEIASKKRSECREIQRAGQKVPKTTQPAPEFKAAVGSSRIQKIEIQQATRGEGAGAVIEATVPAWSQLPGCSLGRQAMRECSGLIAAPVSEDN